MMHERAELCLFHVHWSVFMYTTRRFAWSSRRRRRINLDTWHCQLVCETVASMERRGGDLDTHILYTCTQAALGVCLAGSFTRSPWWRR